MPRTAVTAQVPTRAGLTPTFSAADAANGNSVANDGRTILRIKNAAGASITLTVALAGTQDGISLGTLGKTITVPATTGDVTTAVWPKDAYDQAGGVLYLDWSSGTSVTFCALSV